MQKALILLAAAAWGQEPLGVRDAVRVALRGNPAAVAASQAVASAQSRVEQARGGVVVGDLLVLPPSLPSFIRLGSDFGSGCRFDWITIKIVIEFLFIVDPVYDVGSAGISRLRLSRGFRHTVSGEVSDVAASEASLNHRLWRSGCCHCRTRLVIEALYSW